MAEAVRQRAGTYRYVYDALGRRTGKQHISLTVNLITGTKFLWDGMRLAQESRPEGQVVWSIYRTREVMNCGAGG